MRPLFPSSLVTQKYLLRLTQLEIPFHGMRLFHDLTFQGFNGGEVCMLEMLKINSEQKLPPLTTMAYQRPLRSALLAVRHFR